MVCLDIANSAFDMTWFVRFRGDKLEAAISYLTVGDMDTGTLMGVERVTLGSRIFLVVM